MNKIHFPFSNPMYDCIKCRCPVTYDPTYPRHTCSICGTQIRPRFFVFNHHRPGGVCLNYFALYTYIFDYILSEPIFYPSSPRIGEDLSEFVPAKDYFNGQSAWLLLHYLSRNNREGEDERPTGSLALASFLKGRGSYDDVKSQ
jgi:hypothetical protein